MPKTRVLMVSVSCAASSAQRALSFGFPGDHGVASGLDCALGGPKVPDLGGRGDTASCARQTREKSLPKLTDGSAGLAVIAAVSSWGSLAITHAARPGAKGATELARMAQLLIEHQC